MKNRKKKKIRQKLREFITPRTALKKTKRNFKLVNSEKKKKKKKQKKHESTDKGKYIDKYRLL